MKSPLFPTVLSLLLTVQAIWGEIPQTMSYQGVLANADGTEVSDGTYSLIFSIYDTATGGSALWTETRTVAVSDGEFNEILGSTNPLNIAFDRTYWLGLTVDGSSELTPRMELAASPYSLNSRLADDSVTSGKIVDGTVAAGDLADSAVSTDKLQDGAVTSAKMGSGQVVKSINGLTDGITLTAGGMVTITSSDNTLTIAATADLADGVVTSAKIAEGTVASGDIGSGQVVKSINGLTDGVTLTAGGIVTISQGSDNTLIIAASGGSSGNTLDQAYDQGGAGAGRTVTADNGAVNIDGSGGLTVNGNVGIGTTDPQRKLDISEGGVHIGFEGSDGPPNAGAFRFGDQSGWKFHFGRSSETTEGAPNSGTDGVLMTIQDNGNVGIGTISPGARLEVEGGGVLFDGTAGATPASGAGTRLMWIPSKAAFRAGTVNGDQWDDSNIGLNSTVGGGNSNTASGSDATVSGGNSNKAIGPNSTVGGGVFNETSGQDAAIGGGNGNTASGQQATIGGGNGNIASGLRATIGGGLTNTSNNTGTTVGGGWSNIASGFTATVSGGVSNAASGDSATVAGGSGNTANGRNAAVPGGAGNAAAGDYSFAAGRRATINAAHGGAFLFADQNDFSFDSAAANEFAARTTGGVRFVSAIDGSGNPTAGVALAAGGGSWSSISDRQAKNHFAPVDDREILERVVMLPIQTWNYKSQAPAIRHIGPMAQDFYAAFGVGEDERHITNVDADGVALAAIQGLHAIVREKEAQIEALQARIEALEQAQIATLEALTERITALERNRN